MTDNKSGVGRSSAAIRWAACSFLAFLSLAAGGARAETILVHELSVGGSLVGIDAGSLYTAEAGDIVSYPTSSYGLDLRYGIFKNFPDKRLSLGIRTGVIYFPKTAPKGQDSEFPSCSGGLCPTNIRAGTVSAFEIPLDFVVDFPFLWPSYSGPVAVTTSLFCGVDYLKPSGEAVILDFPGNDTRTYTLNSDPVISFHAGLGLQLNPRGKWSAEIELIRWRFGSPYNYSVGILMRMPLSVELL